MSRRDYLEDYALIERWQKHGDVAARNRLVEIHMGFIRRFAVYHIRKSRASLEDAVQVCAIAFMDACDRFDVTRGVSLLTFAKWRMLEPLRAHVFKSQSVTYQPYGRLTRANPDAWKEWQRKRDLDDLRHVAHPSPPPDVVAELREALGCSEQLLPRDREVVLRLADGERLTDIAHSMGITCERARQLRVRGHRRMREVA